MNAMDRNAMERPEMESETRIQKALKMSKNIYESVENLKEKICTGNALDSEVEQYVKETDRANLIVSMALNEN